MLKTMSKTLRGGGALIVAVVLALSLIPVTKAWATGFILDQDFGHMVPVQEGDVFNGGSANLKAVIYKDARGNTITSDSLTGSGYPYTIGSKTKGDVTYTNWRATIRLTEGKWEVTLNGVLPTYSVTVDKSGLTGANASANRTTAQTGDDILVRVTPDAGKSFESAPQMTLQNATLGFALTWDSDLGAYEGRVVAGSGDVTITVTGEAKAPTHPVTLVTTDLSGATATAPDKIEEGATIEVVVTPAEGKMFSSAPLVEATNATVEPATPNDNGSFTARVKDASGDVTVTVSGATVDATYTAQVNTDALNGGTAELSKTADIKSEDTVSVTIKPSAGKRFDTAPTMTVDGATVKTELQKRPADGAYVGTISTFTKNATVTVAGDAVDAWSATLDKAGLKGGTARLSPTDGLGPDSVSVLTVTFDSNKTVTSAPVVTADNAKVKLALQDGNTYTYEITEFTGNTAVKVTGEAEAADKPAITVSGNGTHVVGAGGTLTFTCSLPLEDLVRVQVDGKTVVPSNYDAKSGSTVITLKAAFLDTLSVGKHTLTLAYTDDRSASVDFTVAKAGADGKDDSKLAKTGDPLDAAPLAATAGIAGIALAAGAMALRKNQQK